MDEKPNDPTSGRHTTGEIARTIVTQSLYNLVRLTRFGFQAAATGFGKIEESMARRQQERDATHSPMGEAPPSSNRGSDDPGQSRH